MILVNKNSVSTCQLTSEATQGNINMLNVSVPQGAHSVLEKAKHAQIQKT